MANLPKEVGGQLQVYLPETETSEFTGVMEYISHVSGKTDALGEEIRENSDALKHWVVENFDKQNIIYEQKITGLSSEIREAFSNELKGMFQVLEQREAVRNEELTQLFDKKLLEVERKIQDRMESSAKEKKDFFSWKNEEEVEDSHRRLETVGSAMTPFKDLYIASTMKKLQPRNDRRTSVIFQPMREPTFDLNIDAIKKKKEETPNFGHFVAANSVTQQTPGRVYVSQSAKCKVRWKDDDYGSYLEFVDEMIAWEKRNAEEIPNITAFLEPAMLARIRAPARKVFDAKYVYTHELYGMTRADLQLVALVMYCPENTAEFLVKLKESVAKYAVSANLGSRETVKQLGILRDKFRDRWMFLVEACRVTRRDNIVPLITFKNQGMLCGHG